MILDLMPNYREKYAFFDEFDTLRSIVIDGHETAWMEFRGHVSQNALVQENAGKPYMYRDVHCECHFTEGVSWEIKDGHKYSLDYGKNCLRFQAALHLRHLELRDHYTKQFHSDWGSEYAMREHMGEIILDLVQIAKDGGFLGESSGGASFWGGYFYLQTVAAITGTYVGHLWEPVRQLVVDKKIGLDGAVIQPYTEPPPPAWEEHATITVDGWVGKASLPGHRHMAQEWKLEVFKPDGKPAMMIPGLALMHEPTFGPDVEDVTRAEEKLAQLIKVAQEQKQPE